MMHRTNKNYNPVDIYNFLVDTFDFRVFQLIKKIVNCCYEFVVLLTIIGDQTFNSCKITNRISDTGTNTIIVWQAAAYSNNLYHAAFNITIIFCITLKKPKSIH